MEDHAPFRADHVGSLLRPKSLLAERALLAEGRTYDAELRRQEDEAIRGAIKMQEEIGLHSVTDGEFRRLDWLMDFKYGLGGVTVHKGKIVEVPFQTANGTVNWKFTEYSVDGKLHLKKVIYGLDFSYLKKNTRQTAKQCIPSPSMMHYPAGRGIDRKTYPDDEEFFADLAKVYIEEIQGLGKLGCTYLQLDDTSLAFLNSAERRKLVGPGADTMHLRYIKLLNQIIAAKPEGMRITTHLCRGNMQSAWSAASDGSYNHVAEALFGELNVDGYFLEYDDERSGGFEPLKYLPKGDKRIVLGLVTTKSPVLESKDTLKRRIDEAAKYAPLEQLCLSPQCGFSSTSEGNQLTVDEQRAKLQLVADVAREVWG